MKRLLFFLVTISFLASSCMDKLAESPDQSDEDVEETTEKVAEEKSAEKDKDDDSGGTAAAGEGKEEEKDDRTFTQIRAERKALEKELEELEAVLSDGSELIAREVKITEDAQKLRAYHEAVSRLHQELEASTNAWKVAARSSFIGVELPEITTSDGRKFTSVVIQKVDDESLQITHSGGSETLNVLSLPVSLRKNILHEATVMATREN